MEKSLATVCEFETRKILGSLKNTSVTPRKWIYAISNTKVYGRFFFVGNTVTGASYLDLLENWLFAQIEVDSDEFIFYLNTGTFKFVSSRTTSTHNTLGRSCR